MNSYGNQAGLMMNVKADRTDSFFAQMVAVGGGRYPDRGGELVTIEATGRQRSPLSRMVFFASFNLSFGALI